MNIIAAVFKGLAFVLWTLLLLPAQLIILKFFDEKYVYKVPVLWHAGICRFFGIRIEVCGEPCSGSTLFIANHISYLDIPATGSVLSASFVAKKEVAGWPVFGALAQLQQTAFIDRNPKTARHGINSVAAMLERGKSIILFAEGTSTDGRQVLPFKSSLLSTVLHENGGSRNVRIQPLTICLLNAATQEEIDRYAWYKPETELAPHLWEFAKGHGATIRLIFHEPLDPSWFSDRKALAAACHGSVIHGLKTGEVYKPELDTSLRQATLSS